MKRLTVWCCWMMAAGCIFQTRGAAEDVSYNYGLQPAFITEPGHFRVTQGDSVKFPCRLRDLGPLPVAWLKDERVLFLGSTTASSDRRMKIEAGHTLRIDRVTLSDGGAYVCSVSTDPVMQLTHHLDVLYGPTVVTVPQQGLVVAERGTDEVLQCTADGKPKPTITWRKQSGPLPGGERHPTGERYLLSGITRQMAGVYECVADNGLGKEAVGTISLQVQYPPEVEVERSTVYTGEGYSVVLVCFVFADPPAKVIWDREDAIFDQSRHRQSDEVAMGTRYELAIPSVSRDDFGRYSCKATNRLGTMTRHMSVTGVADRVQITSEPVSTAPDTYDLSWRVKSFSPIQEYKVAYRRSKHNMSVEEPSVWKEVVVPTTGSEPVSDLLHHQRITLGRLQPATAYDLKIMARNDHGWNAVSDQFHFATLTRGEALESRIAGTGGAGPARRLHPALGALLVVAVIILPAVF